ncbi:sigma intracellular receptor 2 isoform X1 [Pipra filicauda]|uniref:Sigma intracellular receptor 2 isoform X1 n=3 Tax=Passeriformes TaxID=9126 RepID=A0A7R5L1P8_9PASS|nr:sigma intracellular receptor 2 isoform X1 [Pipra filicauda]
MQRVHCHKHSPCLNCSTNPQVPRLDHSVFPLHWWLHPVENHIFAVLRLLLSDRMCWFGFPKLTDLLQQYATSFRDPMMLQPPEWFKAFIYCEAFLQLPFFPVAAYAFLKGGCRWIRTPAIIYSTHVATTLFAILAHILFHDFSKSEHVGPQTLRERLVLLSIYLPYLLIPLLILFTMLCNPHYKHVEKRKRK